LKLKKLGILSTICLFNIALFLNGLISASASVPQTVLGISRGGTNANNVESAQKNLGRVEAIDCNSTDNQLPSAKAIYNFVEKLITPDFSMDNTNFSNEYTNWSGGDLIIKKNCLSPTSNNNKIKIDNIDCTTSGQGYTTDSAAADSIPQVGCVLPAMSAGSHTVKISTDAGANYQNYGTITYSEKPTLSGCDTTSMQTFGANGAACKAAMKQGQVIVLNDLRGNIDSPNGQKYRVKKMPDGNVWMIDNLKLGSTTSTTVLTPADTNISSNYTLPQISNTGNNDPSGTTYCSSSGLVNTHNPGNTTACGYLYNWSAAVAGTSSDSGYSISAKGWSLRPNSGAKSAYELSNKMVAVAANSDGNRNPVYSTTDYKNFGEGGTSYPAPWLSVYSGFSDSAGRLYYQESRGYYWSSTESEGYNAYSLYLVSGGINTQYSNSKNYGYSVRSVL
jgi:uncharacterized protein (TIGR02145 family)